MAQTITLDFSGEGKFYKNGEYGTRSGWVYEWTSSTTPKITLKTTRTDNGYPKNDINLGGPGLSGGVDGSTNGITYVLSVEDGYVITGWSFTCSANNGALITPDNSDPVFIPASYGEVTKTVEATGLNAQEASFNTVKSSDGVTAIGGQTTITIVPTTFTVTVQNTSGGSTPTTVSVNFIYHSWNGEEIHRTTADVTENTTINDEYLTSNNLANLEYYKNFSVEGNSVVVSTDCDINIDCTPDFPFEVGKVYTLKEGYNKKIATYQDDANVNFASSADLKNSSFMFEHVTGEQNLFQLYSIGGKGYVTMSTISSNKDTRVNATVSSTPVVWTSGTTSPTSQYKITPYTGNNATDAFTGFRIVHPGNADCTLSSRSDKDNTGHLDVWNSSSTTGWEYAKFGVDEVNVIEQVIFPEYITSPTTILESTLSQGELACLFATPTCANYQRIFDSLTGNSKTGKTFSELVDENAVYQIEFDRNKTRIGVYQTLELFPSQSANNTKESATYYGSTTNATADSDGNVTTTQVITTVPAEGTGACFTNAEHLMSSLWMFEKKQDGQYYARNVNSGLYISGGTGTLKLHFATAKTEAHYFIMETNGGNIWAMREPETTYSGREYLNSTYNPAGGSNYRTTVGYYKDGLNDIGNRLRFKKITSLPLTVTGAGWTAFCFPVKVTVPDGVTVYQATSSNGESLHLEEVAAGTVLPAGAGFLCEAAEGTYNFGITAADAADFSSNLLTGATLRRTGMTPNNFYALGNKNGVGFYRVNSETVPANKPFLPASALTSSAREMLSFQFGPATGIDTTENAATVDTSVLYDLNGRRAYYPSRGIYVTGNGKKIFIK